jgi:hypothetical protein
VADDEQEGTKDSDRSDESNLEARSQASSDSESTVEGEVPSAAWTGPTSHSPTQPTAPSATTPLQAEGPPPAGVSESKSKAGWFRSSWTLRRWLVIAIPIAVFVIGILIGVAGQTSRVNDLESENSALQRKVDDRSAQSRADEARATRIEQERQRAAEEDQRRQAAAEQRRQQEEQQRQQQEQQRQQQEQQRQQEEQQREAARQNTLPGDGLFAVGVDIRPGRFQTAGPSGGNPVGCYYAILNSPDTSEIATNNITKGPAIVDLSAGKYFETQSCQQWQRIG